MENDNLNLNGVNEIDMECSVYDDDDFGANNSFHTTSAYSSSEEDSLVSDSEERPLVSKTGIILDFSDDDDSEPVRTIKADYNPDTNSIETRTNFNSSIDQNYDDVNAIDMECKYGEDDDDDELFFSRHHDYDYD